MSDSKASEQDMPQNLFRINAAFQCLVLLYLSVVAGIWNDLKYYVFLLPIPLATWGLLKRKKWFVVFYDVLAAAYALLITGVWYAYRYSAQWGESLFVLLVVTAALFSCASTKYCWNALK